MNDATTDRYGPYKAGDRVRITTLKSSWTGCEGTVLELIPEGRPGYTILVDVGADREATAYGPDDLQLIKP